LLLETFRDNCKINMIVDDVSITILCSSLLSLWGFVYEVAIIKKEKTLPKLLLFWQCPARSYDLRIHFHHDESNNGSKVIASYWGIHDIGIAFFNRL